MDTAFIAMASVLHTFNITPSLNKDGKPLDPMPRWVGGHVSYVSIHAFDPVLWTNSYI